VQEKITVPELLKLVPVVDDAAVQQFLRKMRCAVKSMSESPIELVWLGWRYIAPDLRCAPPAPL
jgi:hypothetical protein